MIRAIDLDEKLLQIREHWSPKIVAQMNDQQFKLVKLAGEFVWHEHPATDEVFLVLHGEMTVHFRGHDVRVAAGELVVVPRGIEHKTSAESECSVLVVEAAGTLNTGTAGGALTAPPDDWI